MRKFAYLTISFICVAVFLILASLTIQPEQEKFGWYVLVVFIPLFLLRSKTGNFFRVLVFIVAAFVAVRYVLFRMFFTLQSEETLGFVIGLILFSAELYCFVLYMLNLFVNIQPISRDIPPLPDKLPVIDVLIPTYSEDEEVAYVTALACKNFDYPSHLVNIYILNDGSRLPRLKKPEMAEKLLQRHKTLTELADKAGVMCLTREDGEKAKAGMINATLKGEAFRDIVRNDDGTYSAGERYTTSGDMILILDCDHVPTKDFLKNVVGHFADEKLAMVQTPHFMINGDPIRKNTAAEDVYPCESWLFYFKAQRGLDSWGASYFCGSAAMLRRSALEEIGWISGDTITEDAESALELHSRGYHSKYVAIPMVAGLAPESFDSMIKQRVRWCQGMLQILLLKNPLFRSGLKLSQRLCYMNNCLYWLFPFSRFVFLISPLTFLFLNVNLYNASVGQVIDFGTPYLITSTLMFIYLFGKTRLFLQSEISEMMQSFFLLPAIFSVIISPKKPAFAITPKGTMSEEDAPSPRAPVFIIFFSIIVFGFVKAVYIWVTNPLVREAVGLTMFWNFYNFFIIFCCIGVVWERKQRRHFHRAFAEGTVHLNGVETKLNDLSGSGFSVKTDSSKFYVGQTVKFESEGFHSNVQLTRASSGIVSGFFKDTDLKDILAFVYGSSSRWQAVVSRFLYKGSYVVDSLRGIRRAFQSSLLCIFFYLARFRILIKSFYRLTFRKIRSAFLLIFLFLLLFVNDSQAESVSIPVNDLVRAPEYTVTGVQGEFRIPFYIPKRADAKSVDISLKYKGQGTPEIYLTYDAERVDGIVSEDGIINFSLQSIKQTGQNIVTVYITQQMHHKTIIDLEQSKLTVNYNLHPVGERAYDIDYIIDPYIAVPKVMGFILEKNDEEHIKRAVSAAQNMAIRLIERPLYVKIIQEPDPSIDCIAIGDTYKTTKPKINEGALFTVLNESDLGIPPVSKRMILEGGNMLTFKELGLDTVFFRQFSEPAVTYFAIPAEARLTPNRKMSLLINLMYSPNMPKGATLDVMVNDQMFAHIRLKNKNGEFNLGYKVDVPTSLLSKGVNRLWLKANLDNESTLERDDNIHVTVFGTSSIKLPDTGIYVNIPELKSMFSNGYPFTGNSTIFLHDNSSALIEPVVNFGAVIAQKRGTIASDLGIGIDTKLDNMSKLGTYPIIFAIDDNAGAGIFTIDTEILEHPLGNTSLKFSAASYRELTEGIKMLWRTPIQEKIEGRKSEINILTGEVINTKGRTVIISNIPPFPKLAFYTSNYPVHTAIIIATVLLVFSILVYFTLRRRTY